MNDKDHERSPGLPRRHDSDPPHLPGSDVSLGAWAQAWRALYDRSADEPRAIQAEAVENITAALVEPRSRGESTIAAAWTVRSVRNE